MRLGKTLLSSGALLILAGSWAAVRAQDVGGVGTLERQLEQVRRDTRLQALKDAPVSQRALFDSALATVSYLSLDDAVKRQPRPPAIRDRPVRPVELRRRSRLLRPRRFVWQDWHSGDSFNGHDDTGGGELEEAYYRFDLGRYFAVYEGKPWDDQLTATTGRQFAEWATGLVLSQYVDGVNIDGEFGNFGFRLLGCVDRSRYGRLRHLPSTLRARNPPGLFRRHGERAVRQHRPYAYGIVQRD